MIKFKKSIVDVSLEEAVKTGKKLQENLDSLYPPKKDCFMCEGTGIYYAPNGENDVVSEPCDCRFTNNKTEF